MVFSVQYDRFTAYYNCMSYNFRNLISPRVQCTKTTNRYISSFDRFTDYYNRMSKNFKNLLSPWVQCTSITNRVLSSIDRFTAYYNCMRKKFKNLITPYVKYASITNRFLSSFDRFTVFTTVRSKTSKISIIRDFNAQVSPIVFSAHLTVLRLVTTVWEKTLKNLISPWVQCTSIKNRVLSSLDRFTVYYNCMR